MTGLFMSASRAVSLTARGLTRRAKHRHSAIIETSLVDPRGTIRRGFFRSRSRNRTAAAHCGHALVKPGAPIGAPSSEPLLAVHARTCRPAAPGVRPRRCGLRDTEIGFAPETMAPHGAICRAFYRQGEMMTAYLISLAVAGLVAIVLWETFS